MKLEKIISLANQNSKLRFLAMVRSLRETGCNLPIWVIPYDDNIFELPENCIWWEIKEFNNWLKESGGNTMMRKYQCLFTNNYQYVDSDVIFLKDPEHVLSEMNGFIASCGHWHNPQETHTDQSKTIFKEKTTTWQKAVFNAGQYACDLPLYTLQTLQKVAEDPKHRYTCLEANDQAGMNLLVFCSGVVVSNLTLQPYNMQSTWAGDYWDNYKRYWTKNNEPYIIHWAGCKMDINRPIDELMINFFSEEEKKEWEDVVKAGVRKRKNLKQRLIVNFRKIKHIVQAFKFE